MSPITESLIAKLQTLSPEKQQQVAAFIDLLQTNEYTTVYKDRFAQLYQEIQVGLEASARGDVIDSQVLFENLQVRLQQRREKA